MLISRALAVNALEQRLSPANFIAWADCFRIQLPAALREAVATITPWDKPAHRDLEELRKQNEVLRGELEQFKAANKDLKAKERRSLQILVATMAWRHYDYIPNSARNLATKLIVDDASLLGLSIDKDTVLNHLRQAFSDLGVKRDPQ